jgi:hypothetical protein
MANDAASMSLTISTHVYELRPELILAIAIVVLALVTAWMARETRRTATTATRMLELEQMPILGLRGLKIQIVAQPGQQTVTSIRVGMELFNAGRVPVKYRMKSISVTFANQHTSSGQFVGRGRVLPGSSLVFWHPSLVLNPPISTFPASGDVHFEYEYSDESWRQLQSIVEKVTYAVSATQSGFQYTWLNVEANSPIAI